MIKITEIFPNPEGQDGNKEWIELTNLSSQPINLQNYILDDEEGGSKPYTIPHLILEPTKPTLLRKTKTNLNLNNDGDTIRIFKPTQDPSTSTPLKEITYGKTTQGLSYSLTTILSKDSTNETWTWTTPTPEQTNSTFYNFSGTIAEAPKIEEDFQFTFQPEKSHDSSPAQQREQPTLTITFTEEVLDFETAETTLTPGTSIQILTSKITNPSNPSNSNFQLIDYKIASTGASTEASTTTATSLETNITNQYPSPLPALAILLLITILIITLKLKKKFFQV